MQTLFCGDVVGPAIAAEDKFHASCLHPGPGATVRTLADDLDARVLAAMKLAVGS